MKKGLSVETTNRRMPDFNPMIFPGLRMDDRRSFVRLLNPTTKESIVNAVCRSLKIEEYTLKSKCRKRETCEARFISIHLMLSVGSTLTSAGSFFNRDHSSAIYARDQFKNLLQTDKEFKEKFKKVNNLLMGGNV